MSKKDTFQIHLKAGHGRTELKNGSIAIVAEPGKTIDVDAKQYRLAMSSKIFSNGPFKVKKPLSNTEPSLPSIPQT